jgi:hypothetical protein
MSSKVESRAQIVRLDEEGILRFISKRDADLTIEDAEDIIRRLGELCGGKRRPILVDLTALRSISRAARAYFAGPETVKIHSAAALLINSPLSRGLGNFFMGFNKSLIPVRLFTSEAEALDWLRPFRE